MIKEILLKKIDLYTSDKNGTPYMTKDGRRYTRAIITDSQNMMYSGFSNATVAGWQVGMTVKINAEAKEYNGKTYWNFKTLSREDELELRLMEIERYLPLLKKLNLDFEASKQKISVVNTPLAEVPEEMEPADFAEDLPFN